MSTDRTSAIPATASALHRLASGDFANNPHPLHPYLAHFPAAFFVAAFTSDFWLKWIGNAAIGGVGLGQLSGALHAIAVGAAVPAALTGAAEYFNILSDPGRNTVGSSWIGL